MNIFKIRNKYIKNKKAIYQNECEYVKKKIYCETNI